MSKSNNDKLMGRAYNIAQKAMIDEKGLNLEPHFIFTESEFREFVRAFSYEQKIECCNAAFISGYTDYMGDEILHAQIESADTPEVI